jgi:hypothetical protein
MGGDINTMFPDSKVARAKMRVYGLHEPSSSSEDVLPVPVLLLPRPKRRAIMEDDEGIGCATAEAARTRTKLAILIADT